MENRVTLKISNLNFEDSELILAMLCKAMDDMKEPNSFKTELTIYKQQNNEKD